MKNLPLDHMIKQLQFNYLYLLDLVGDIEENKMTFTPSKGLENHPTFTVGHIITAYGMTIKHLGGEYTLKKSWDEVFRRNGPGDSRLPTLDKTLYPSKKALILELKNQHLILLKHLSVVPQSQLSKEMTWRFSTHFPKLIDMIYFMSITHYAMHISQLAAWRRAMNLPSSLGRM